MLQTLAGTVLTVTGAWLSVGSTIAVDSARQDSELLKAIVRERDNKAGVYGTVTRRGRLAVGDPIFFEAEGDVAARS
jgi:hypothetical protein